MLTADLLRVRDDGKEIVPRYLKLKGKGKTVKRHIERAEAMIALFRQSIDGRKGTLDEAIGDLIGDGTDFNLSRGIKKLLEDRSEFETVAIAPPQEVRALVFEISAAHHPIVTEPDALHVHTRDHVLAMAAEALQTRLVEAETPPERPITAADIDAALYADLDDNQRLLKFKDIEADALLDRYNLALAQAALYRARELRIHLTNDAPGRYRQLFRTLKFHRLMHRVRRNERLGGWDLTVDGPISLLKSTSKYGLQMAMFLPALLLCEGWSMEADLAWGPKREPRLFKLDDDCGLRSHYRVQGVYITDEQRHFEERFAKMKTPWTISHDTELYNLGGKDILAPDLVFKNKDDGRVAMLELVGFWRKGWLKGKTDILAKHGPPNLILAVSDRLRTDGGKTLEELPVAIFPFKGVLLPKKLLALLEDVAR